MEDFFLYDADEQKEKNKKTTRKFIALFLSAAIVIAAIGLFCVNIALSFKNDSSDYLTVGNNYGNISSGGYAAGNDGIVYFSNANDNYSVWMQNSGSGQLLKINDSQSWYIVFYEGWIYYSNYDDGYSIHKMLPDGSNDTKLNDTKSLYLNICNGWIYYTDITSGGYIFKMNTDGENVTQLNHSKSVYLCVYGEWIYYSNSSNLSYLYKIKTDGSGETLLNASDARNLNIQDGWIYYTGYEDDEKVFSNAYRIKTDGTKKSKISDEYCSNIITYGEYVYFVSADGGSIGRFKSDGSKKETVYELTGEYFEILYMSICCDKIYYCVSGMDSNYSFAVNTDGTENMLIQD